MQHEQAQEKAVPLVIGLAGGIGSGKSAVAAAFKRLGCAVIDSDAEAKAALERPEVVRTLVEWWGPGVVGANGTVDRKAVAQLVFADSAQRTRLEGLIHPLIRRTRAAAQREAARANAPAIIYDAPLLFEAGIDAVCDAVVFVDAPIEARRQRVWKARGWDSDELSRREAAQMPLEQKRSRSRFLVQNPGEMADGGVGGGAEKELDRQAGEVLAILSGVAERSVGASAPGRPLVQDKGSNDRPRA